MGHLFRRLGLWLFDHLRWRCLNRGRSNWLDRRGESMAVAGASRLSVAGGVSAAARLSAGAAGGSDAAGGVETVGPAGASSGMDTGSGATCVVTSFPLFCRISRRRCRKSARSLSCSAKICPAPSNASAPDGTWRSGLAKSRARASRSMAVGAASRISLASSSSPRERASVANVCFLGL